MSQNLQALEVFGHIAQETLERTPITLGNWVHPYQPGDELQASSLGSTTLESRRQQLPVLRTPRKQFGTRKTPSRSGSKNKDCHPRRMLSPALVTPGAAWSVNGRSWRTLQPCSSHTSAARWSTHGGSARVRISKDFHWQPWPLSLIGNIAVSFTTVLASVAPQDWNLGQKLRLAVCYLTVVGSLILIRCLL